MDHKEEPLEGAMGVKQEELPQMDGSCDACEPDEAQPATQVCHICSFAFCPVHADVHSSRTSHTLMPYNFREACANEGASSVGGRDEEEPGQRRAVEMGDNQGMAAPASGCDSGPMEQRDGAQNGSPQEAEGAEGAEAGPEAMAAGEAGKRDTVTVERLRCKVHGQEGSLYCKPDEKIICVVCAVQGEHKEHEIITLHEAYVWQKGRQTYDLLGFTQEIVERIKTKWTNPEMSTEELEQYVNNQFEELRKLVRLEEKRTLHLVDLKEAFLTASAAEKIAEITVETEKLQEEMDSITHQLCLLETAEAQAVGPEEVAEVLAAVPAPVHRALHNVEARPRCQSHQCSRGDNLPHPDESSAK
ncbi:unnamed protein product [Menidia menidia]|uniref:(Atlantic silverside) hypothetical protein n=1 Tax=Menidia menidia TaxID=238744 RepID=A0A8S4BGX2_9TELE|nr:unnamed protein product [Menidia menidia]